MPLNINGLQGRMLHIPGPTGKKREILLLYGHHASLERLQALAEVLSDYGTITMPDLPGFGGMDSLSKIGQKPSLDNLADYLATFIKLRYRRKHVTIIGVSLGFVIATRMLQRYPDLVKKVDLLVSAVGFTHHDDFTINKSQKQYYIFRVGTSLFTHALPAAFFKNVCLNPLVLKLAYRKNPKFVGADKAHRKAMLKFEHQLWHINDVRTYMLMSKAFFTLDNCQQKIDLPIWHVVSENDRYFDNHRVEQHMRIVFSDFHAVRSNVKSHGPSIILDTAEAKRMVPPKIRQLLAEPV